MRQAVERIEKLPSFKLTFGTAHEPIPETIVRYKVLAILAEALRNSIKADRPVELAFRAGWDLGHRSGENDMFEPSVDRDWEDFIASGR